MERENVGEELRSSGGGSVSVGILALQGLVDRHLEVLRKCGVSSFAAKRAEQLAAIDGLIIPGGESTTICRLIYEYGLAEPIIRLAQAGVPIWGICAGLIILGETDSGKPHTLRIMDVRVRRNAFGRQADSFQADLLIEDLGQEPFKGVFIRAPQIVRTGPEVRVLASIDGKPVLVKERNLLGSSFHPELVDDTRLHRLFLNMVNDYVITMKGTGPLPR